MKPTLLILAAGMGSRYGGLKQIDQLGPNGETIMDCSIKYAVQAGFGQAIFVIRRNMEADFKQLILDKYIGNIAMDYLFQELDSLPKGFNVNPEREKPYGTAHAILVAKETIKTPFAVINADDFYGKDSFQTMCHFLTETTASNSNQFAMIGYQLGKTLSENGTVSRGVCKADNNRYLLSIEEMMQLKRYDDGIKNLRADGSFDLLAEDTPVSMNFWGFSPLFFDCLEQLFIEFLQQHNHNPTAEFAIPTVINNLLQEQKKSFQILPCSAEWFGVTYQEDRPMVVEKLRQLFLS